MLRFLKIKIPPLMCVCVGGGDFFKSQKRASGPLDLELQAAVSYPTWVLATKLELPGRVASILDH